MQGCLLIGPTCDFKVDLHTGHVQNAFYRCKLCFSDRNMKWGPSFFVLNIYVSAGIDQQLHDLASFSWAAIECIDEHVQWRVMLDAVNDVWINAIAQHDVYVLDLLLGHCQMQVRSESA